MTILSVAKTKEYHDRNSFTHWNQVPGRSQRLLHLIQSPQSSLGELCLPDQVKKCDKKIKIKEAKYILF